MPYNFLADSIHKYKLCTRFSLTKVYTENCRFAFLSPLFRA